MKLHLKYVIPYIFNYILGIKAPLIMSLIFLVCYFVYDWSIENIEYINR